MKPSLLNKWITWTKNVSIVKKLYFVIGTMALLIAFELFMLVFTMKTLSSTRALVGAEGLWSKAQKDATYYLQKYGLTKNEKIYQEYLDFLSVPHGDSRARHEMMKANPDLNVIRQGFIEGRVHPNDIDGIVKLLVRFNKISYINDAIVIWGQGDSLMSRLEGLGSELHEQVTSKTSSGEMILETLDKIDRVDQDLTILEDRFSFVLGEGSRWLEKLVLRILFIIALTVEFTGLFLTISVSIRISKGIKEIIRIASKVSKTDFTDRAKVFSQDEIGKLAGSFNQMIDDLEGKIIEQRRTSDALRNQKDLYETLLNAQSEMGEGVSLSIGEKTVYVNDALCKMNGYTEEEIINMSSLFDMVLDSEKPRLLERMKMRLDGQSFASNTGETFLVRKDGKVIDVEYSFRTVLIDKIPYNVSIIRDITERKQSEYMLRSSEEKFLKVFQSSPVAISITSIETQKFVDVNESFLEMMEFTRDEVVNHSAIEIGITANAEDIQNVNAALIESGYIRNMRRRFRTKNGNIKDALISVELVDIEHEKCILVITHDITELIHAKDAIEQQARELTRSNADLEQFAYIASHDLQEPLRTVVSYLQLLESRYKNKIDKTAYEFINFAVDGAKRMHILINDLLAYSRIGTNKKIFSAVNCAKVIDVVLSNLQGIIQESSAEIIVETKMPSVKGDQVQITQLFQNLIDNAIKYRGSKAPVVKITATRKKSGWQFSFSDNGIGIGQEYKERIFVIFQRLHTREKYIGTGIGLALCKKIVEGHGGKIWVESELDKGSTFHFIIPFRTENSSTEPGSDHLLLDVKHEK